MSQSMPSRRLATALIAAALLSALAGMVLEESYARHTDDGCPVEIHCLACRLAVGTAAVAPTACLVPLALFAESGAVATPERRLSRGLPLQRPLGRAPPLS
jgi:hypothetical protein